MKIKLLAILLLITCRFNYGQLIPEPVIPDLLSDSKWTSSWIKRPEASNFEYGVYLFRNRFNIDLPVEEFIIHISADSRYKLYVNDKQVGLGPAKSDIDHWIFDTYDISDYLNAGENIIAAEVWNYGIHRPVTFMSSGTRFLCQGNGATEDIVNTPGGWVVIQDHSRRAKPINRKQINSYIAVAPGDLFDCALYPWDWTSADYDDSEWIQPVRIGSAELRGKGGSLDHALVPRLIPAMKFRKVGEPQIRRLKESNPSATGIPINEFIIRPNSRQTILLDNSVLINAYPLLTFSGGKNSKIKLTYSESLFDSSNRKGNRDVISGKKIIGYGDMVIPDGGDHRSFTPLWFRTYRYVQLEIVTESEPLVIHSFENYETGYPFEGKAFFNSGRSELDKIWETGWRTSLLCAGETYYDCPYYEQLQYAGDTRIQALISLYTSGDDRLMRKAIIDFYNSILPEGLTQSRYPSDPGQVIPTYSLLWISMLNDYLWHRPDYQFIFEFLVPMQNIISWFEKRIDPETGMLGHIEFWPFIDWTEEWEHLRGTPPEAYSGNSSIITLMFAMVLDHASEIFNFYGYLEIGNSYANRANELKRATKDLCWDQEKEFMADSPEKVSFSQHANSLAVLTDAIPDDIQALVIDRTRQSDELIKTGFYFSFYLHRAMIKAGLGNKYLDQLGPWHDMIGSGLTTFAEKTDPTRSDCHAWSASPLIELIATVAGISPGGYGFETVIIEPNPGNLEWINASMPHYLGDIEVDLKFSKNGEMKGTVELPEGLSGVFIWKGSVKDLNSGVQKLGAKRIKGGFKIK